MERLEKKRINGHSYYYYSKWAWVGGRCRRLWQNTSANLHIAPFGRTLKPPLSIRDLLVAPWIDTDLV